MDRLNSYGPVWAGSLATLAMAAPAAAEVRSWHFHAEHVLGTSLDITVVARDQATAAIGASAAKAEIIRLDAILSDWRSDSELAALNGATAKQVSKNLFEVIAAGERWREATGGAFDGRLGEVLRLWRQASASGVPTVNDDRLRTAMIRAGGRVGLDAERRIVSRPAGVRFDLDGLAKGYIVDAALTAARRAAPGLAGFLVNIGGDVRCWGQGPYRDGWCIGITHPSRLEDNAEPLAVLRLTDKAVATSGRGARDLWIDGQRHSHLISPSTGLPVEEAASATVVADRAADADALATAFSVMPPNESLALANRLRGVEASLVASDGRHFVSQGWDALTTSDRRQREAAPVPADTQPMVLAQATTARSAAWPEGFALGVQYEIPPAGWGRYRRPYVVIWITDASRRVVRTLLMLGDRPHWQDDNYMWWRQYGSRAPAMVDAVSRPTRAPGRYTAIWDGTDDQGRPVPQGRYTLHIEAARQYGGHSYGSTELDLGTTALERALPSDDEFGATRLSYGRRR